VNEALAARGAGVLPGWRDRQARRLTVGLVVAVLSLLSFVLDVATGPAMLPVVQVGRSLAGLPTDASVDTIVWTLRLPIAFTALAVGAALGLSGAVMQTLLNNPLASSYTLGISAGAGFGAAVVIVLGTRLGAVGLAGAWLSSDWAIPLAAFLFAGLACAGVWWLGTLRGDSPELLVLAGIAMLFMFQALQSLLQFIASPEALQQLVFWLFGSLQKASWAKLAVIATVLGLGVLALSRDVWALTALRLGDEAARGLGVSVRGLRLRCFVIISALTGVAVAFVGTIGFVGLVAPHVARMAVGEDQRAFLPVSALTGALLLSAASVGSKSVMPGAIFPIGIVTALIGVPCFILIILRHRRPIA